MAITTWAQMLDNDLYYASVQKTGNVAAGVAGIWATTQSAAGNPTAGLGGGVPTVAVGGSSAGALFAKTAGAAGSTWFPDPSGGASAYLKNASIANSLGAASGDGGMTHMLFDKVWGVNLSGLTTLGTATITAPPAISGRMLNGTYNGTMIVLEIVTGISATATTVNVTYTNQAGTTGRTSVAQTLTSFALGRWVLMPLQADDTGVQKIETIVVGGVVATAGVLNVLIVKPYSYGITREFARYEIQGYERAGTILNSAAALYVAVLTNGTTTGQLDAIYEIAEG